MNSRTSDERTPQQRDTRVHIAVAFGALVNIAARLIREGRDDEAREVEQMALRLREIAS